MDALSDSGPDAAKRTGPGVESTDPAAVGRTDESSTVGRTDRSSTVGRTDRSSTVGRTDRSNTAGRTDRSNTAGRTDDPGEPSAAVGTAGSAGSSARDRTDESTDSRADGADGGGANDDGPDAEPTADGGVLLRLARRTAITAGALGVTVLLITATGLMWPGWFARPVGLAVGVLLVIGCTVGAVGLLRRSGSWTALTASTLLDSPGVATVVGEPRALHGARPMVVRRRRYAAQVVPIRSATGPWTRGAALIVHGRSDGVSLRADDDVVARWTRARGPFLLQRPEDGALFAAERSTLGAW